MSAKPTIRCAIYTRKSSEEGLAQEFNSLDAQHEACAAYIASQVAEWQGNIALVIDPFDEETAAFWKSRYEFLNSATPNRLWLPLQENWLE